MNAPIELTVTLGRPAAQAGEEPQTPTHALLRVGAKAGVAARPILDLCFVVDASASMHQFHLDPEQRSQWEARAQQRGELARQSADGKSSRVWSGQTLRELQEHVSTPMLSCLRGVWRTLVALEPPDRCAVIGFADTAGMIYEDSGGVERPVRLDTAKAALSRLGGGVDQSGLGRGTRLAGALRAALERARGGQEHAVLRRIILVSDGVVEDREACDAILTEMVDAGIVISVIGVGDDFDEEFLMQTADLTRGSYYYAPTAPEVEQAVSLELAAMSQIFGRSATLTIRPQGGSILSDVYQVTPTLAEFRTLWVENGGWRFSIGDLSEAEPIQFLVKLAPPAQAAGEVCLATALVEAKEATSVRSYTGEVPIKLFYTDEAVLLQAHDSEVEDAARRLEVYREERRAAEAMGRGDTDTSTRHLRAATRMLREMGEAELAEEMDSVAADAETGTRDLRLTKKVKAGTRRLGASS